VDGFRTMAERRTRAGFIKKGAQTGDETLSGAQVGSTLAAAMEDA